MYVLFEPTCSFTPLQYEASRGFLDQCNFRWIAFPNRTDVSKGAAARLAVSRSMQELETIMRDGPHSFVDYATEWERLIDRRQDIRGLPETILPLVRNFGGGTLASPTSVFMTVDGRVRLVRGAWEAEHLESFLPTMR